jgi:FkbM family methyltransferase
MSAADIYRRALRPIIKRLPAELRSAALDAALSHLDRAAYQRLRDRGFRPQSIIDIGAHIGDWTRVIKQTFPDVPVLMVEARDQTQNQLDAVVADFADVRLVLALLGAREGEVVTFYVQGSGSSLYPERSDVERSAVQAVTTTVDTLAGALPGPLFLKLDVQGAELDVLRGAAATLKRTEIIQLEVPLLPYNEKAPDFEEVIGFMSERGFVPYDIAGFVRPFGQHLVQVDLLFVPRQSPLRPRQFQFLGPGC